MKCKRTTCQRDAAPDRAYCTRECAPYGYYCKQSQNPKCTAREALKKSMRDLADKGLTRAETAAALALPYATVHAYSHRYQIKFKDSRRKYADM